MTDRQQPALHGATGAVAVFDLDGTLLDSDAALLNAFVALGVPAERVTWGHVVADECQRLGIDLQSYLDAYDLDAAQPYAGAHELVVSLDRWAVVSNKHPDLGHHELERLGWQPEVALFADAFDGPKQLGPALNAMGLTPSQVLFVGDTAHDRACARAAGAQFALAGWNPRAATAGDAGDGEVVLGHPREVADVLARMRGDRSATA